MRQLLQVTRLLSLFKIQERHWKEITLFLPICLVVLQKDARRGRPETPLINRLRVSFWSHWVLISSQTRDVQDLEAFLRKKHLRLASGLWSRYMRGEVVPQGALVGKANSLVHRIGMILPNTAPSFYMPLWDLLMPDSSIDFIKLKSIYLSLGDTVYVHFVSRVQAKGERSPPEQGRFWHLDKTMEKRKAALELCEDPWIRLVACLLEARMSYAAQKIEPFVDCQLFAAQLLENFQQQPYFQITRLQGVLLTMEALCLDALVTNVVEPPPINETHQRARDKANLAIRNWANRCRSYTYLLSPSSQKSFARRLTRETQVGKLSYFGDFD